MTAGTSRAVRYINVKKNAADLDRMFTYNGGRRRVPVIVDDDPSDDRVWRHVRCVSRRPCAGADI